MCRLADGLVSHFIDLGVTQFRCGSFLAMQFTRVRNGPCSLHMDHIRRPAPLAVFVEVQH